MTKAKAKAKWIVGTNMPGYMPDNEPFEADDWAHGKQCLVAEIERDLDDAESDDEADLQQLLEWAQELQEGHEFGATANNRHYWLTRA